MRNLRSNQNTSCRYGRNGTAILATLVLVAGVVLGVALPVAAGTVLFTMDSNTCSAGSGGECVDQKAQVGGSGIATPTLMTTPTANGGKGSFTIPATLYASTGSFTSSYGAYPYFVGIFDRRNFGGSIKPGNWTPSAVKTFYDDDTQYPAAPTPAPGKLVANVGPNGMAGPNVFRNSTYYYFQYNTISGGFFVGTAVIDFSAYGGPLSTNPTDAGFNYSGSPTGTYMAGVLIWMEPNIWAFTGTLEVSQPDAGSAQYFMTTAMDNRTSMGASGTIQVVSAALFHNYTTTPTKPPLDSSAQVDTYRNALVAARRTEFQFIPAPEPGQLALIGVGVAGLAGLWTMRRRG